MGAKINQYKVNGKEYTEIVVEDDGFIVKLCDLGASIRDIIFHGKHMVAAPDSFEEFMTALLIATVIQGIIILLCLINPTFTTFLDSTFTFIYIITK